MCIFGAQLKRSNYYYTASLPPNLEARSGLEEVMTNYYLIRQPTTKPRSNIIFFSQRPAKTWNAQKQYLNYFFYLN